MVRACSYKDADAMYHIYGASPGSYAYGNTEVDLSFTRHFINLDIRYDVEVRPQQTMNTDLKHILGKPTSGFDVAWYIKRHPTCELWSKVLSDGRQIHYKVKLRRK